MSVLGSIFSIRMKSAGGLLPVWGLAWLAVLGACINAYSADEPSVAFEVASLKPSGPISRPQELLLDLVANDVSPDLTGHGRRVEIRGMSAAQLIAVAYKLPSRNIVGPSWMSDARFDVEALIPSNQPIAKGRDMLGTLLRERLALRAHPETRKVSGYILSVARGGPKLKEAAPFQPTGDIGALTKHRAERSPGGVTEEMDHCDMAHLANSLTHDLGAPVEDRTGLIGFYSILIQISSSDFRDEIERQSRIKEVLAGYGLRLDGAKIDVPIIVVDNLLKTPASN